MHSLPLVLLVLLFAVRGAAQPTEAADVPRTPWGWPALGGVWTNSTLTPLERPDEYGDRGVPHGGRAGRAAADRRPAAD